MEILGIDIGGSGIKGAIVDVDKGALITERDRILTPEPSIPDAVGDVVTTIVQHFDWHGPIGITFPAVVKNGITLSAANVDKAWIGYDAQGLFRTKTGCSVLVLNDADAAGMAEMKFGAGRNKLGVVMMLTIGTGIGSAIFFDGVLVPNTELGHLVLPRGKENELFASDRVRGEKDLSWKKWAKRLNEVLLNLEYLFSPDLFILGGGVSKDHDKFIPRLTTRAPIVPAQLLNEAGIVGAALAAKSLVHASRESHE
jgi:polyphosphate glucokinase